MGVVNKSSMILMVMCKTVAIMGIETVTVVVIIIILIVIVIVLFIPLLVLRLTTLIMLARAVVTLFSISVMYVTRALWCAMQGAARSIHGIASLPLPHAQRSAIAAVDDQGTVHLFFTPLGDRVIVSNPSTDAATATAAAMAQQPRPTALGSTAGSAPAAAAAAAQEGRLEAGDSGHFH